MTATGLEPITCDVSNPPWINEKIKKLIQEYQHKSTQINTSQRESTRVRHESTQARHESTGINTSLTRVNTNQHESNTSQHESVRP